MRVTFGKYLPRNSLIHNMDSRLKLVMIILLIISIFFPVGFTGYAILTVVILSVYAFSKLSWRTLLNLFIPVIFIFIMIFLINIILIHPNFDALGDSKQKVLDLLNFNESAAFGHSYIGRETLDTLGLDKEQLENIIVMGHFTHLKFFWFSERAAYTGLLMGWRIYLMITLTTILTASTQPLQLTLAIEDLLLPLKIIGVPVYVFSMIISIALRMIPTLIDEAGRIMKAQSSRGIDIKNGKLKDKAKGLSSLIIPLLVSSFQKAEDLAYAMDARDYNPYTKRTRYIQFKFRFSDLIIFLSMVVVAAGIISFAYLIPMSEISNFRIPYIERIVA